MPEFLKERIVYTAKITDLNKAYEIQSKIGNSDLFILKIDGENIRFIIVNLIKLNNSKMKSYDFGDVYNTEVLVHQDTDTEVNMEITTPKDSEARDRYYNEFDYYFR